MLFIDARHFYFTRETSWQPTNARRHGLRLYFFLTPLRREGKQNKHKIQNMQNQIWMMLWFINVIYLQFNQCQCGPLWLHHHPLLLCRIEYSMIALSSSNNILSLSMRHTLEFNCLLLKCHRDHDFHACCVYPEHAVVFIMILVTVDLDSSSLGSSSTAPRIDPLGTHWDQDCFVSATSPIPQYYIPLFIAAC